MPKTYPYIPPTREELLTIQYGEACKKIVAAHILGVSAGTVATMLRDGRLKPVCEGKMVCVRSIARYMERPAQLNFEASIRKRRPNQKYYIIP